MAVPSLDLIVKTRHHLCGKKAQPISPGRIQKPHLEMADSHTDIHITILFLTLFICTYQDL